jgi:hypothetical protein
MKHRAVSLRAKNLKYLMGSSLAFSNQLLPLGVEKLTNANRNLGLESQVVCRAKN